TASQTGWALLALLAAGEAHSDSVRRGIGWLLTHQAADGSWHEDGFTGTGFPRVFYLNYHNYRLDFPLIAFVQYQRAIGAPMRLGGVNYRVPLRAGISTCLSREEAS